MVNSPGPTVSHNKTNKYDNNEEKTPDGCDSISKKKRFRRRQRSRKTKKEDLTTTMSNCSIENGQNNEIIQFTIEAINNQKLGIVYRLRNTKYAYINLEALINQSAVPKVFETINKRNESNRKQRPRHRRKNHEKTTEFPDYFTLEQVENGLKTGELIKGHLRINPKNPIEAYVGNADTSQSDYIITTIVDRNRALDGDEVVLKPKQIDNNDDNNDNNNKKQMQVVYIWKRNHPRICVGFLKPFKNLKKRNKLQEIAEFSPRDKRIPKIRIPRSDYPDGFEKNPKSYGNCLFSAQITEWTHINYCSGILLENLGKLGDLRAESVAILKEFCLNTEPIPEELSKNIVDDINAEIVDENREDLRDLCIFTIDPDTAKDLDDAVSCRRLPNGNYEIGVHISDVTHYLQENTELDEIVRKRATTIYMIEKAYHMLPLQLCLNCSLLPNVDKLTLSVFWEINPDDGVVIKKRSTKSTIKSCAQLSYNHAQLLIENQLDRLDDPNNFPPIYNNFTIKDLWVIVNDLNSIAKQLRAKRFKNGALRLDQIKINFNLNPNGEPSNIQIYENLDAHRLIEEFMLLANITVAETIQQHHPDVAFLRLHEPPKLSMLVELQKVLETLGIFIDITSAGSINASLIKYSGDDCLSKARMIVLQHLFAKPMTRARYFCYGALCGGDDDDNDFDYSHYALSIPIYTHFTSPIRRYADIMVHRLLKSCLGYCDKPTWTPDFVHEIAEDCNRLKYQAKKAGEASSDLYLAHYIDHHQPFIEKAVIIDCKEKAIDVIVLKTGSTVRLYTDKFGDDVKWRAEQIQINPEHNNQNCRRTWRIFVEFPKTDTLPSCSIVLEIFTVITVSLRRKSKTNKLEGNLLRP